jgi:hypothetical protein
MTTPRTTRSGLKVLAIGMLIALPVLYVASVGPVYVAAYREWIDMPTVTVAYSPLLWLADEVPAVDRAMLWYVNICLVKMPWKTTGDRVVYVVRLRRP